LRADFNRHSPWSLALNVVKTGAAVIGLATLWSIANNLERLNDAAQERDKGNTTTVLSKISDDLKKINSGIEQLNFTLELQRTGLNWRLESLGNKLETLDFTTDLERTGLNWRIESLDDHIQDLPYALEREKAMSDLERMVHRLER
jgi:hypothetical protein